MLQVFYLGKDCVNRFFPVWKFSITMCGIVGILNQFCEEPIEKSRLCAMRDTMVHRGPDGAGLWISEYGNIGLAHRRLSIIDLSSSANQPMSNRNATLWITFNGEIYNHAEIRAELESMGGFTWSTDHSDTEVILNAYQAWGIDCVDRFRGAFAFALWDVGKQHLWLVRDRIGIKPLYWTQANGRFYFASEIKAIIEDPSIPRVIDEEAFFHWLTFMTTPAPMTLFKDIKKIQAGHRLLIKLNGEIHEECWWDVFDGVEKNYTRSRQEWAELLQEELRESVRYRGISDVPVGVFLSGGIDSSTNAVLFNDVANTRRIKTFTIGYQGSTTYSNEHVYARKIAKLIRSEHYELDLSVKDLIDFLPRMIYYQDEPIADPVCIPVYYVSELAKKNGITVAQVGEGADELFWGYPLWKYLLIVQSLNRWPVPRFLKQAVLKGLEALGKDSTLYYEWLRRGISGEKMFWGGALLFTERGKDRILSKRLKQQFAQRSSYEVVADIYERYKKNTPDQSDLDWMSYCDLKLRLPELLLMRVDKMCMGASVEGRVPFLDHKFVQLAMSIPQSIKTEKQCLKSILKQSVRGIIPDDIIDRKKQGFGVPVKEWMMKELGAVARESVDNFCDGTDVIDRKEAIRLLESGSANAWPILNLALWWKRFIE